MPMPWYLGNSRSSGFQGLWSTNMIIPLMVWSAVWTGLALWHAARRGEKWWFIFFLLVHTAGIAEILYLAFVVKVFGKSVHTKAKRNHS